MCFISVPLFLYDTAHTKVSGGIHPFKWCFHWHVWHSFLSCWRAFCFLPRGHLAAGWWTSSGAVSRQHPSLKELLIVQQFHGQSGWPHKAGVRSWVESTVKLPALLNGLCFVVTSWEKGAGCGKVVMATSPMIRVVRGSEGYMKTIGTKSGNCAELQACPALCRAGEQPEGCDKPVRLN